MKTRFKSFLALLVAFIMFITLMPVVLGAELTGPQLKVESFSSDHANPGKSNDYGAVLAVDDNPDTFWSNDYNPKAAPPHFIVIDLGSTFNVTGFKYLPRQDGYTGAENGNLGTYKIYTSTDNVNFTEAYSGKFDEFSSKESMVSFSSGVNARYFKLWTDQEWIGVAELKIITDNAPIDTPAAGDSNAADSSVKTDKQIYAQGENIVVSYTGSANPKYWVGICSKAAKQYQGNTINVWLFANSGTQTAGNDTKESGTVTFLSSKFESKLTPGEYTVYLMKDDWSTQVAQANFVVVKKGEDTTVPTKLDAPSKITYTRTAKQRGYAAGKVTITPPKNDKGIKGFDLFWADDKGKLASYTHIGYVEYKSGKPSVYEIPAGVIYPNGAKRIIAYSKSWGSLVSNGFAYISLKGADLLPVSKKLYSFQVMSDIHTTTNASDIHNLHFNEALKDIKSTDPKSSGIFTVGDNTDHGYADEWKLFKNAIDTNLKGSKIPVYVTMGNHDLIGSKKFEDSLKLYKQYTGAKGPYYSVSVNNNTFIVLASQTSDPSNAHLNKDQLTWLKNTLKTASAKGGPVFVFLHQPLKDTVSGSLVSKDPKVQNCANVADDKELRAILDQYKNVTLFTGHTHWQFDSFQPILMSNGKTANYLNSASVGYLWTDENTEVEGAQGYYVEVYQDYVLVRGRDFVNKQWVPNAQFMLNIKSPAVKK